MNRRIEKLRQRHPVEAFEALNLFLQKYALQNQHSGGSQTYVGLADHAVISYYSSRCGVGGATAYSSASEEGTGQTFHSYHAASTAGCRSPLAETRGWCRALKDATLRTLQAADIAGIRALVVHAKDESARTFYERFDFLPSPSDPLHLFILLKDILKIVS